MTESPRHDLDQVIDRVAAKMVALPDDAGMLPRTLARLPERTVNRWFLAVPVQLAAAAAIVVVAFLFARPSPGHETRPDPAAKTVAKGVELVAPAPVQAAPSVPVATRRLPTPDSHPRQGSGAQARPPVVARDDHERSLPPVDAIRALELVEIAPPAMQLDATAALEPLVLPELALDPQGDS